MFATRSKATSIIEAVRRLGLNGLRQVVITAAVLQHFKAADRRQAGRGRDVWRQNVLAGEWVRLLCEKQGFGAVEEAKTSAFLHGLGELALRQHLAPSAVEIATLMHEGTQQDQAEMEVLGLTTSEIGGYLCHHWNFPPELSQAIALHRAPPSVLRSLRRLLPLTKIVNAACHFAHMPLSANPEQAAQSIDEDFLVYHGLTRSDVATLAPVAWKAAEETAAVLLGS